MVTGPVARPNHGRVLIVDDDQRTRRLLSEFLKHHEYETVSVSNGGDALALLRTPDEGFDLMLLDIQMPGLDGRAVAQEVRRDSQLHELPILAFTAHSDPADAVRIMESGCDAYLSKPANLRELAELVEALMRDGRPGASEAASG